MSRPPDAPPPLLSDVLVLALVEARRYGDDDLVWIRELVQNARDAGARHITFRIDGGDIVVDDDGSGMSRDVVVGQLLRLFSSSKATDQGAAGCFGVGFWSVLRAGPERIAVDAVDETGAGVGVVIDVVAGTITERAADRSGRGTTIRLATTTPALTQGQLRAGILRHAAMVQGRGEAPPVVGLVDADGSVEVLNRRFDLADLPGVVASAAVRGPGFAGHVGLSPSPRVELFHHGLRVVDATDLASLVPSLRQSPRRGLGLVLRVDVPGLKVLVDRRTVVEDDTVRALVSACDAAAARLEREVLDEEAPLPFGLRLLDGLGRLVARPAVRAVAVATLAVGVGLLGGVVMLGPRQPGRPWLPSLPWSAALSTSPPERPLVLADARAGLGAPRIDVAGSTPHGYQMVTRGIIDDLLAIELRDVPDDAEALRPRAGPGGLARRAPARPLPIVATAQLVGRGLTVLPRSQILWPVRAASEGVDLPIGLTDDDMPAVLAPATSGVIDVFYGLAPPPPPTAPTTITATTSPALLPLVAAGRGGRSLTAATRIGEAVAAAIAWAADPVAARRFDADARGVVDRALALGVGDCDVINAVYVRALQAAGFQARLARGLVVKDDVLAADLHAWVEVFIDGGWHLLDASPRAAIPVPGLRAMTGGSLPPPPPTTTTTTMPPSDPSHRTAPAPVGAIATAIGVGLGVGLGAALLWRRRRRQPRRRDRHDDVVALLVAGLHGGAAEALGLLDRAVLPTSHGTISLRRARSLAATGRLALTTSTGAGAWLHASVHRLQADAPRVRALRPFLPALVDVDALLATLRDDDRGPLPAWQGRIDRVVVGVALRRAAGPGVRECLLRSRDGRTHQVLVGDDVVALPPDDGLARLLEEATSLWHLGMRR